MSRRRALAPVLLGLCLLAAATGRSQLYAPWSADASARGAGVSVYDVDAELRLPRSAAPFALEIPSPGGEVVVAQLRRADVMPALLAARFPEIVNYRGLTSEGVPVAVTQSPSGLEVYVRADGGSWQVEAIGRERARVGKVADLGGEELGPALSCGYTPAEHDADGGDLVLIDEAGPGAKTEAARAVAVVKKKYVLALACTGEYGGSAALGGGTQQSVMAKFNQAVNVLNAVTLSEAAMEFELHPLNDVLIFTDPGSDPYNSPRLGTGLLGENPPAINNRIDVNSYDLGHVFTAACQDVGGVVSGRACSLAGKARGVTCNYSTNLTSIVENVMAHECAHQFAVSHSWNNCPGNDGQRAGQGAYEPGSGSTIMSYQGACGAQNNVSNLPGPVYYHVGSLQQFADFTEPGAGGDCADFITTANELPEIAWPYADGFAIPHSTPFVLSARASDPEGEQLFFNWEQYNLGNALPLCTQNGSAPLFRSVPPDPNGRTRYFPDLQTVITGGSDCEELLPDEARPMSFRMTVRDRSDVAGGTAWEQVDFETSDFGPFAVTSQTSLATTYAAGEFVSVTWDVANTDQAPVNCQTVDILLSMDNGRTFPDTLLAATPNDGSEGVLLPQVEGNRARIKVQASDNIFYNLSPSRFAIVVPTEPGFTFVPSETTQTLCLPEQGRVEFFTSSLLGFDEEVSLSIANAADLPAGVVATLSASALAPGESAVLDVDFSAFNQTDSVRVVVEATAPGVDPAVRELLFDVVSNDFSDLALMGPDDGEEGVSEAPTFRYSPSSRATEHVLEVSTDPTFGLGTIVIDDPDPSGQTLFSLLERNSIYFWRVLPSNRCGEFLDAPVNVFHTYAASCQTFAESTPILIPPNVRRTVEAVISIPETGEVSDLNVPLVDVQYSDIRDVRVQLVAPDQTSVTLLERRCGGISRLRSGFDDESIFPFTCDPAPVNGDIFKPRFPLSTFDGAPIQGDWRLQVEVLDPSNNGGEFKAFEIEFCANIVSQSPTLAQQDIPVPTGGFQFIAEDYLRATDPDNSSEELEYMIVSPPSRGRITVFGQELIPGDRFSQSRVNQSQVRYVDLGDAPGRDSCEVLVTDNSGNLITPVTLVFDIADGVQVGTRDRDEATGLSLMPNPTAGDATLRFAVASEGGDVRVVDARGAVARARRVPAGAREVALQTAELPAGLYYVLYRGAEGAKSLKLVVE